MKDKKSSLLLVSSLILLLISVGLLSAWAYFYFQKKKAPVRQHSQVLTKEAAISQVTRDSLRSDFTAALTNMDTSLKNIRQVSDTSQSNVNGQIRELYDLRKEIPALLNTTNQEDLDSARIKIITMQLKIDELKSRTQRVESENKRLNA
ncbi:MAG TPA: hypothetical protein VHK91_10765, partial [Flavisolibacter sp.]|nr:hypothetical protein [Flavisolibacter sp.]